MKQFFLSILLIMLYAAGYCQPFSKANLIGIWKGKEGPDRMGTFNFIDSNRLIIISPDKDTMDAVYKIDSVKDAFLIDIIDTRPAIPKTMEAVIRFSRMDAITIEIFDEKRPAILPKSNPDNTLTFRRVVQTK